VLGQVVVVQAQWAALGQGLVVIRGVLVVLVLHHLLQELLSPMRVAVVAAVAVRLHLWLVVLVALAAVVMVVQPVLAIMER
jgi:hypothetical protein